MPSTALIRAKLKTIVPIGTRSRHSTMSDTSMLSSRGRASSAGEHRGLAAFDDVLGAPDRACLVHREHPVSDQVVHQHSHSGQVLLELLGKAVPDHGRLPVRRARAGAEPWKV